MNDEFMATCYMLSYGNHLAFPVYHCKDCGGTGHPDCVWGAYGVPQWQCSQLYYGSRSAYDTNNCHGQLCVDIVYALDHVQHFCIVSSDMKHYIVRY